jgi:hypothetical protein
MSSFITCRIKTKSNNIMNLTAPAAFALPDYTSSSSNIF